MKLKKSLLCVGFSVCLAGALIFNVRHSAHAGETPLQIKGGGLWPYLLFTAPVSSTGDLPLQSTITLEPPLRSVEVSLTEKFEGRLAYSVRRKRTDGKKGYSTSVHLVSRSAETSIKEISTEAITADSSNTAQVSTFITDPQFSYNGELIMLGLGQQYDVKNILFTNVKELNFYGLMATRDNRAISPVAQGKIAWSDDNAHIAYFGAQTNEMGYIDEFQLVSAPRTIYVQDWHEKTRVVAAQSQGAVEPLAWQNDRLLFGALPPLEGDRKYDDFDASIKNKEYFLPRPNIYAYSVADGKTTLLIKDGYRPSVSPDGKLIAFYGSSDPQQPVTLKRDENPAWYWRYIAKGASLCFAKADGSGRTAMQPYYGLYPRIQWLPDNRRFVTIYQTKRNPDYEAQLTLWDTETQSKKELGVISVSDDEKRTENDAYAPLRFPFYPMGTTADGKNIIVKTVSHNYKSSDTIESLQLVNIETGQISMMATFKNIVGLDWTAQLGTE